LSLDERKTATKNIVNNVNFLNLNLI